MAHQSLRCANAHELACAHALALAPAHAQACTPTPAPCMLMHVHLLLLHLVLERATARNCFLLSFPPHLHLQVVYPCRACSSAIHIDICDANVNLVRLCV